MPRRGLREKIVHGINLLPNITEEDLFDEIGIDLEPSIVSPFLLRYEIGSGMDREVVLLNPGDTVPLRESEAAGFLKELQHLGAVVVSDPDDEDEMREAELVALRAAHKHFAPRGAEVLRNIRIARGISKDEMEDMKSAEPDWAYWRNEAIAKALNARIKELRAPAKKKSSSRRRAPATADEE